MQKATISQLVLLVILSLIVAWSLSQILHKALMPLRSSTKDDISIAGSLKDGKLVDSTGNFYTLSSESTTETIYYDNGESLSLIMNEPTKDIQILSYKGSREPYELLNSLITSYYLNKRLAVPTGVISDTSFIPNREPYSIGVSEQLRLYINYLDNVRNYVER